jgi:hypothetical protein
LLKDAPFTLEEVAVEIREEMKGDGETKVLADRAGKFREHTLV